MPTTNKERLAGHIANAFNSAAQRSRNGGADLSAFIALDDAASEIAKVLARSDKRFDRKRFMDACGILARRDEVEPFSVDGYDGRKIIKGQRIELAPTRAEWIEGYCFGEVVSIHANGQCLVKLDRRAGARIISPSQLRSL